MIPLGGFAKFIVSDGEVLVTQGQSTRHARLLGGILADAAASSM